MVNIENRSSNNMERDYQIAEVKQGDDKGWVHEQTDLWGKDLGNSFQYGHA